jgi:hypothetical protein
MNPTNFETWSNGWRDLRKFTPERTIEEVLEMWRKPTPKECINPLDYVEGERKNFQRPRGEQHIERWLLRNQPVQLETNDSTPRHFPLFTYFQNAGLANKKRGNRIVDCLGLLKSQRKQHPLAVEVKVGANTPWYAVIENLQQIRMLQFNVANVEKRFREVFATRGWGSTKADFRGGWGLVLAASESYFSKAKVGEMEKLNALLTALQEQGTHARIILGVQDLEKNRVRQVGGYQIKFRPPLGAKI